MFSVKLSFHATRTQFDLRIRVFCCIVFVHIQTNSNLNLILELKNVFSLDMPQTKEGTNVTI
jgi:hypothetical protein